ncbi:MAG: hypothetical protein QNK23_11250 [Crocinitomicaceae bacterium]|nr:hypothetical protein [Crocinitomicaceae bacterium]
MKNTLLITALLFISISLKAQDTIRKINGTDVIANVTEIGDDYLIYTRFDQPEGPSRKMAVKDIMDVVYSNGTKEVFNQSGVIIVERRGPDKRVRVGVDPAKDGLLGNGFYVEGMMGYAYSRKHFNGGYYSPSYSQTNSNITAGLRIGTKWYFGENENMRFGLNMSWMKLQILLPETPRPDIYFAPVNIGFAGVFKVGKKTGIETNTSLGLALSSIYQHAIGVNYGADVKFRYEELAIGLDFSRTDGVYSNGNEYANMISLTIGAKF